MQNYKVMAGIWYIKATLMLVSLIWMLLIAQQLHYEILSENRDFDQFEMKGSSYSNGGVVYLKNVQDKIKLAKSLEYFDIVQVQINPSCPMNQPSNSIIFIFAANYKQVSEDYLAFCKEMETIQQKCYPFIFTLKRKKHLLTTTQYLLDKYQKELQSVLSYFLQKDNITILTYEEGSVMMLHALAQLPVTLLNKINKIILINTFNPHLKFLNQSPQRYIQHIKKQMIQSQDRINMLNQIRMIFINTLSQWNPTSQVSQEQFRLVFKNGKQKFINSVFIETRFMKNIFSLIKNYQYFSIRSFTNSLAHFCLKDIDRKFNKIQIEYYFYYGNLYGTINYENTEFNKNNCLQFQPTIDLSTPKHLSAFCGRINVEKLQSLEKYNKAILIYGWKNMIVYNQNNQKIEPSAQNTNSSFYIFEKLSKTKQIFVINGNNQRSYFEIIPVYSPMKNEIPLFLYRDFDILKTLKTINLKNSHPKQYQQPSDKNKFSLVQVCPDGNKLLYPLNFQKKNLHFFSGKISSKKGINCYDDKFNLIPDIFVKNWDFQRNLIMFVLVCGSITRKRIFTQYFLYFSLSIAFTFISGRSYLMFINFLVMGIVVILEKSIEIMSFLLSIIHKFVEIRYQRLILLVPIAISILKEITVGILDLSEISSWKIFCLSLVFVVNKYSIVIFLYKFYFLYDLIVYNHTDTFELAVMLIWMNEGVTQRLQQLLKSKEIKKKQEQNCLSADSQLKICKLDLFFIGSLAICLDSPANYINHLLNFYILASCLKKSVPFF